MLWEKSHRKLPCLQYFGFPTVCCELCTWPGGSYDCALLTAILWTWIAWNIATALDRQAWLGDCFLPDSCKFGKKNFTLIQDSERW